jgi:ectoine hydroxylase-related dioxygenase (phytanoyl-CoA dioxygenase family)
MHKFTNKSGIIKSWINASTLNDWRDKFMMTTATSANAENSITYGIDKNNKKMYLWFEHVILKSLRKEFPECELFFAHYMDSKTPLHIHCDTFPEKEDYTPYVSFLIPISVDNDAELCNNSSTIILDPGTGDSNDYEKYFTHESVEKVSQYKIRQVLEWNKGDLLWWDSTLYHASNNFLKTNSSKQCIVIHTKIS